MITGRQEILLYFTRRIKQRLHGKTDEKKKSKLKESRQSNAQQCRNKTQRDFSASRICLGSERGPPSIRVITRVKAVRTSSSRTEKQTGESGIMAR